VLAPSATRSAHAVATHSEMVGFRSLSNRGSLPNPCSPHTSNFREHTSQLQVVGIRENSISCTTSCSSSGKHTRASSLGRKRAWPGITLGRAGPTSAIKVFVAPMTRFVILLKATFCSPSTGFLRLPPRRVGNRSPSDTNAAPSPKQRRGRSRAQPGECLSCLVMGGNYLMAAEPPILGGVNR